MAKEPEPPREGDPDDVDELSLREPCDAPLPPPYLEDFEDEDEDEDD